MLRDLLLGTLNTAGYNTISNENGLEAWNKLQEIANSGKPITDTIQLIITDIEMPQNKLPRQQSKYFPIGSLRRYFPFQGVLLFSVQIILVKLGALGCNGKRYPFV